MNIMELGAIGELLGGVAVIASLIFVGWQVRQNTRQLVGTLRYSMTAEYSRLTETTRGTREHAALFVKVSQGDPPDAVEEVQFEADIETLLNQWWGIHQAFDLGLVEADFYLTACDDVVRTLKSAPAVHHYMRQNIASFPAVHGAKIFAPILREAAGE